MKKLYSFIQFVLMSLLIVKLISCATNKFTKSNFTDDAKRDARSFNIKYKPSKKQLVSPSMVFIEGGFTIMGTRSGVNASGITEEIEISSFYLKETKVMNIEWSEYLHDLEKNYSKEEYKAALA